MSENMDKTNKSPRIALAIAAHPDDIEFMMGGTLLLLKEAGYETHYMNLANGNCGSLEFNAVQTSIVRKQESIDATEILKCRHHDSICNDLEILYTTDLLRRLTAVIREVKPTIVLTQPPADYMEDHMNTCRLAVTAAFSRGMPNFETIPSRPAVEHELTVYHALPYGLRDGLNRPVNPGIYINTTSVYETKLSALACHKSQQNWLDMSQRLNSYLSAMEEMSLEVGIMSGVYDHAEGWQRHSHLGFCSKDADPLRDALGENYLANMNY